MKSFRLHLGMIYGLIMIASMPISQAVNFKILEIESDKYHNKLLSNVAMTENEIRESLMFAEEKDFLNARSKPIKDFLSKSKPLAFEDDEFKEFFKLCSSIQEALSSEVDKYSVSLLFENVLNKFSKSLELIEKAKQSKPLKFNGSSTFIIKEWMNMDKSKPLFELIK
jgi:hypothetical protein